MGFSNIIRGVGHKVASVGHAVQAAAAAVTPQQPPQPGTVQTPAPAQAVQPQSGQTPSEGAPQSKGFQLPDLGPGPDANAPEFQGDEGKAKYNDALMEHNHKKDIHQAFQDLDKIYQEAHPGRDFEGEYREQAGMLDQQDKARPHGNNLARAALALGDFNPAVQQSGKSNLDTYNQNVEKDAAQSDKGFSQRMILRQRMHEAAAADAEAQGNWKKALAEQEKAALLASDSASIAHQRDMEKTKATIEGARQRTVIRGDAMTKTAQIRADAIATAHDLSGTFLQEYLKDAAKERAKFVGPHDLTKDYSEDDLNSHTAAIEHLAEHYHDLQYGVHDGGAGRLGTHPSRRPAATSTGKDDF